MLLAYLDPGSGSALLGTIFALCGAVAFSFKSIFYRIFLRKKIEQVRPNETIVLFSEGRGYWGTFQPIIDELLSRGVPFSYYTLDIDDPALKMDSPLMFSRLYDKDRCSSFKKIESVKAVVMLATTPNIGCAGYPLRRPPNVKNLVHLFHDPTGDLSYYRKGSLDYYDTVLTVGPQNEKPIRELERKRKIMPKMILPVGAVVMDGYVARRLKCDAVHHNGKTIMIAASWGDKGLLRVYGYAFIKDLIDAGFVVIVRPHPHSMNVEREFIEKCERDVCSWGCAWDVDIDGTKTMARADIMISDASAVRFDFAYLFERPVITMKIQKTNVKEFEADDLDEVWTEVNCKCLGAELDTSENIVSEIRRLLSNAPVGLKAFRDANCVNFGRAAKVVVDYLVEAAK